MHFLAIQHLDIETPALIAEIIAEAGHRLTTVQIDRGESLPDICDEFDGIIIMGGPQSAKDAELADEVTWVATALQHGLPMIGICLGAQVMAKAAGASILPSPLRELGWYPVYRTEQTADDALFTAMPDALHVFQWHGETFTITDNMTLLASHPEVPAQVFRLGNGQYGLQCHIEVDQAIIDSWIDAGASERDHLGSAGINRVRADGPIYQPAAHSFCRRIIDRWLSDIGSCVPH